MANNISTDVVAAGVIGSNMDRQSDLLMQAYNLQEGDGTGLTNLVSELKLPALPGGKQYTLEGAQMAAQRLYDRATASYTALTNLFRSKKQTLDAVIQNIK